MGRETTPAVSPVVEGRQSEHTKKAGSDLGAKPPLHLNVPERFAQVVNGFYRSGYPDTLHLNVWKAIGIKTILRLVEEDYDSAVKHFLIENGVRSLCVVIVPNKAGSVKSNHETVDAVMTIIMDPENHPLVVHCNQGKHRTGSMIGCFRTLQGWEQEDIVAEYRLFAGRKARALDEAFIHAYKPSLSVRKTAENLDIASWVTSPDALTGNLPVEGDHLPHDTHEV
ncbi:putative tyrosine-protein phosphatase [Penicillium rolfsii]|nr:putative tyrosine-protein phosphatase [Penicillium rolfsii]